MDLDELRKVWRLQDTADTMIEEEKAVETVMHASRRMDRTVFWRDVRESVIAFGLAVFWVWGGHQLARHLWPWYAGAALLCWIGAFIVVDRRIQREVQPAATMKENLEQALRKVNHQIALLRNVLWWYLLPCLAAVLLILGEMALQFTPDSWGQVYPPFVITLALVAVLYPLIYWLNQQAVKKILVPLKDAVEQSLKELGE